MGPRRMRFLVGTGSGSPPRISLSKGELRRIHFAVIEGFPGRRHSTKLASARSMSL
jgi:hypothetical protein